MSMLDLIPGVTWIKLAAIGVAASAVIGSVTYGIHHERDIGRAEVQAKWDKEKSQYQTVALKAEQANRTIETERVNHASQIVAAVVSEQAKTKAAVARFAGDNQRLRDQLAAIASGGGGTPSNPATVASASAVASTYGHFLGDCSSMASGLAERAEDLASQVRGLQDAYNSLRQ